MLLYARSVGVGSCWTGDLLSKQETVKEIVEIYHHDWELMAIVAFGYPNKEIDSKSGYKERRPIDEFIDKWWYMLPNQDQE